MFESIKKLIKGDPWAVGKQVVCLSDRWNTKNKIFTHLPRAGSIYTIRDVIPGVSGDKHIYLLFEEIRNPSDVLDGEARFARQNVNGVYIFRPVRKTKLGSLEKLRAPSPDDVARFTEEERKLNTEDEAQKQKKKKREQA